MASARSGRKVALGFRVHTGWATAIALAGGGAPEVLERRRVELWDPAAPESKAPYHAALELTGKAAERVVERASKAAKKVTARVVRELADEIEARGDRLCGVALVVGSDPDLARIGNAHIRAHAAEGVLYREALEAGAKGCGVPSLVIVERDLYASASAALGQSEGALKSAALELGRSVGRPWRGEEKSAALAAWVALR